MQSWSEYFELSKNNPPSSLLEKAIPFAPARARALDLGAGSLKDSKFLLSMGFTQVTAIDNDPAVKNYSDKIPASQLKVQIKPLENLRLPANHFDLINASYSLPFTKPPHLPPLVKQIINSLVPKGIFCGQFFGPNDTWNQKSSTSGTLQPPMSFTDHATILKLLAPLEIIQIQEVEQDSKTIDGQPKHWHLFHVIARKT